MPSRRDFELDFDFDSDSWGELDFASETEMKAGEEQAKEEIGAKESALENLKASRDEDMSKLEKMIIPLRVKNLNQIIPCFLKQNQNS